MESPADLVHSDSSCMYRNYPKCLAIYGTICSMFMMSFERSTASNSLKTYEHSTKRYGYKLAAIHIFLAIMFTEAQARTYGHDNGETAYCIIQSPKGKIHNPLSGVILIAQEALTIAVFRKLLRKNESRLKTNSAFSLSERYQIAENLRMIRIMLPIVWSHVLITIAAISVFLFMIFVIGLPSRYFSLFEDSINLVFLQSIFMPFFFLRRFKLDSARNRVEMETNKAIGEALNSVYTSVIQEAW